MRYVWMDSRCIENCGFLGNLEFGVLYVFLSLKCKKMSSFSHDLLSCNGCFLGVFKLERSRWCLYVHHGLFNL